MNIEAVRTIFPELSTDEEILSLLEKVSGICVKTLPAVDELLSELDQIPPVAEEGPGEQYIGFDAFARSLSGRQRRRIEVTLERNELTRERSSALADAQQTDLTEAIQQVASRTLIAVMHVLGDRGLLSGATSQARFRYFCRLSGTSPFIEAVLGTFPELRRQIDTIIEGNVNSTRLLLERALEALNRDMLRELIGDSARITRLSRAAGDSHAGGQAVCIIEFENGRRLVYKPRAMQAEQSFYELVSRFNKEVGIELPLLRVVSEPSWGWQEHADLTQAADGREYFRAAGQLLAILHVVRASDMHYENVLNHHGLPVVIDAETLFSINEMPGTDTTNLSAGMLALAESVHSVGFLPTRVHPHEDSDESIDIGFLGYEPGQTAITQSVSFRDFGTDRMSVEMMSGTVQDQSVLPRTVSNTTDAADLTDLCEGFAELYDWMTEHRQDVRAWVIELFSSVSFRVVIENTRKYYQLLSLSTHPTFQQSPALTDVLFHRCGIARVDHMTPMVIRAEIDDLLQRDIPYFTMRTDATSIYRWNGETAADVLLQPPLDRVLQSLDRMSARLRDVNISVIQAAYVDKASDDAERDPSLTTLARAPERRSSPLVRPGPESIVKQIADEISLLAHPGRGSEPTTWIGATITNSARRSPWRLTELGDDLYAGRPGLSLFLAAAGHFLGDATYTRLAESYLIPRCDALLADPIERQSLYDGGMAGGYPGLAYVLISGGALLGKPDWADRGLALWEQIPTDLPGLEGTDLLMGSAGLLAASMGMRAPSGSPGTAADAVLTSVAQAAFRHVVDHAPELSGGYTERIYSGYAHGTSGLLAALAAYAPSDQAATPYLAQLTARHTELFQHEGDPWAISTSSPKRQAHGWCHGTPGILLSEYQRAADPTCDRGPVVDQLITEVMSSCFNLNYSMCHGDLGNLVILRRAARLRGNHDVDAWVQEQYEELARTSVSAMQQTRAGKTFRNDSLFVGRSGVGYTLMQLSDQVELPSVLTFASV